MKRRINTSTLLGRTEKTVEHESDVYTNYNWCSWYNYQRINKRTGGLGNKSGNHPHYCIIEIGQNTERRPGDLKRFAVTQTPVKDHQLTLMWKTLQNNNNNNNDNDNLIVNDWTSIWPKGNTFSNRSGVSLV